MIHVRPESGKVVKILKNTENNILGKLLVVAHSGLPAVSLAL